MNGEANDSREQPATQAEEWREESRSCPACGGAARRVEARFCATCGRALEDGYFPADTLRASYHQQPHRRPSMSRTVERARPVRPMTKIFPTPNRNGASTTALAFVTYALVPYLGILFCPGALLVGSVALVQSFRAPQRGGRRAAYTSIILGLAVLGLQIFLWWILYKVPEWAHQF